MAWASSSGWSWYAACEPGVTTTSAPIRVASRRYRDHRRPSRSTTPAPLGASRTLLATAADAIASVQADVVVESSGSHQDWRVNVLGDQCCCLLRSGAGPAAVDVGFRPHGQAATAVGEREDQDRGEAEVARAASRPKRRLPTEHGTYALREVVESWLEHGLTGRMTTP
jgi:hypothetical protein